MKNIIYFCIIFIFSSCYTGKTYRYSPYPTEPGKCPEVVIYEMGDFKTLAKPNFKQIRLQDTYFRDDEKIKKEACSFGATHAYKFSELTTIYYYEVK